MSGTGDVIMASGAGMVTNQVLKLFANFFKENLIQVSSPAALANEGLFELTRRPLLTPAVSLSFAKT